MHGSPHRRANSGPTLRRRLRALLVWWLVLFLGVVGLMTFFSFSHFRRDALDDRLLLARTVAQSLDSMLGRSFQSLGRLPAQLSAIDASAFSQLRSLRFQDIFREAVFLLDADGQKIASDPAFAASPFAGAPPDREVVTPLFARPETPERPTLAIVQPFTRERQRYYLVSEMNPRGSLLSTFLQDLAPEPDLHIVVIDRAGKVIAASDQRYLFLQAEPSQLLGDRITSHRSYVAENAECTFCDESEERSGFLMVMAPLRLAPWGVLVQQHRREAFATLYASQAGMVGLVAVLAVAGLLLSHAVSRSVMGPIQELSNQAERLRRGDLSHPIRVGGDREIRLLAATLDEARDKLSSTLAEFQALNDHLEEEVASRTRVLGQQDEQRRVLVRRLLDAGEEERRRIARELHDEISQLLAVIQISLDDMGVESPEMRKARQLLRRTQKEVHRIVYDLRPSILDDLGLPSAVDWYAENYLIPQGIQVHLEVEEGLDLPDEVEITAFRIYQEIVTNILRHSHAENVSVELYVEARHLILAVEDDGVGFAPEKQTEGVGIVGMRERATLVSGTLSIDSDVGLGTHVRLEIPLDKQGASS